MSLTVDMQAFGDAWDVEPDSDSLEGVADLTRRWLDGELEAAVAQRAVGEMIQIVRTTKRETEEDLRENPELHERLRLHIEGQIAGYEQALILLPRLAQALTVQDRAAAGGSVAELEHVTEDILAHCDALDELERAPQCPRCGGPGEGRCPTCALELLIPIPPNSTFSPTSQEAHLGPEFLDVFESYNRVLDGQATLASLWSRLETLEGYLRGLGDEARMAISHKVDWADRVVEVPEVVKEALEGASQMRRAEHSRQVLDLSEGWDRIFRQALHLLGITSKASQGREATGPTLSLDDQVNFSAEAW